MKRVISIPHIIEVCLNQTHLIQRSAVGGQQSAVSGREPAMAARINDLYN